MRLVVLFLAILPLLFLSAGCVSEPDAPVPFITIKSYKDIPGVTPEEIVAIEALKSGKHTFSYGSLFSTEAFLLPTGDHAGFTTKFCALLTELFGAPFIQKQYTWDDLMESLASRSLDFTGDLTPTAERLQQYAMSAPIAIRTLRMFTRTGSDALLAEADVNGRKLGFLEGAITADSVKKAYPLLLFTVIHIDTYQTAARMLENGEIDAFVEENVGDPGMAAYDFIRSTDFFPMAQSPVSMATANPVLAPVISVINKYLAAGGIDRLHDLYTQGNFEYARYKLHRSFTNEEKAYLETLRQQGASVAVAFERDNYPVNFYNEKERKLQGIALDVLTEISRLSDIQFVAADAKGAVWPDISERIPSGDIRMVAQLLPSEARNDHVILGEAPYSRSHFAILSRAEFPNLARYQLARATVGVVRLSGYKDVYHELFPANDNLKEYGSFAECLDALESGEVDLLMASEYMLLTQIHYRQKPGFKINLKVNAALDSYFGFHKDEKILSSIVSKAQRYVHTDEIETRWVGRVFDYSKKVAEERAFFLTCFAGVLSVVLLLTALLLVRNMTLSRKLKEMANTDSLTGILNRRCFMELGAVQIERALRTNSECFGIIFDLDHFKALNDTHGHLAGDMALREVALRVKNAIRPYDLFGRYGGEEFILLVPDVDATQVAHITERIRLDLCQSPVEFEGRDIAVAASFGIARASPEYDIEKMVKYADEALYQAKREGRNKIVFHENSVARGTE